MDMDLPDDYLSPRSKIAKLLEDIDEAPTPSPKPSGDVHVHSSWDEQDDLSKHHLSPTPGVSQASRRPFLDLDSESSADDGVFRRPIGRAARRMLGNQARSGRSSPVQALTSKDDGAEDLYSATPVRRQVAGLTADSLLSPIPRRTACSPEQLGLFVSPSRSAGSASDDDLPDDPLASKSRFNGLVAAKRKERLAAEQALDRSGEPTLPSSTALSAIGDDEEVNTAKDAELEKILSDASRPARKASKKALLEMERETQRLAREQALAHQMKVKKKFTTNDLFARFNFRQAAGIANTSNGGPSISSSSSPLRGSDSEHRMPGSASKEPFSTPPSSPPTPWEAQKAKVDRGFLAKMVPVRQDSLASLASNEDDAFAALDAFKAHAETPSRPKVPLFSDNSAQQRSRRTILLNAQIDAEEDLDIMPELPPHLKMFDKVKPAGMKQRPQSKALHALKHLAHINHSDGPTNKKNVHTVVDPVVVNAQLIAKAKAQARKAQQERLDDLKAKGVIIMSAEEQEREAEQLENLLEKARTEADELRKKERAAAKRSKEEANEGQAQASDDEDEDADYNGDSDEDDLDRADNDSGSEDNQDTGDLLDAAAEEAEMSDASSEVSKASLPQNKRRDRRTFVLVDDEDDEEEPPRPVQLIMAEPADQVDLADAPIDTLPVASAEPNDVDEFAAFGFENAKPAFDFMSPTQAFRATMQTPSQFVRPQPVVTPSVTGLEASPCLHIAQLAETGRTNDNVESQSQLVPASQLFDETQPLELHWETQLPETPMMALKQNVSNLTENTPGWEPSQDAGLPSPWTAARRRRLFATEAEAQEDHQTQSTVRMRISESPEVDVPQRRGRLTKGVRHVIVEEADEEDVPIIKQKNAFSEMQKRRLEGLDAAQRAEADREMRNMMDEQAEESEDEYAGLGGDDSNMIAPETAEDRAMIDESNIELNEDDERSMAKFFAERQRQAEEEATSKLYKDITTGALRRRQGVGWELDEDEDEIAARRRQMRQREEARKRKLLLQDENVKGLLEGKGNTRAREAFLRTIGDDDDALEAFEEDVLADQEGTQSESQQTAAEELPKTQPLHEISPNKRPRDETASQQLPVAKIRRVLQEEVAFSRPTSVLQVRQSLSFLLDEPEYADENAHEFDNEEQVAAEEPDQYESDGVDEEEMERIRQNDGGFAANPAAMEARAMPPPPLPTDRLPGPQRRTPAKSAVIDRLSMRRGSSSSSGSNSSGGWNAWSTGSGSISRAPSLLRRATSNLSAASNANERGVSYNNGASNANDRGVSIGTGAALGGSKKSSLAYQARAEERRQLLERSEKQRLDGRRKIAALRRQQGGSLGGASLGGQWE